MNRDYCGKGNVSAVHPHHFRAVLNKSCGCPVAENKQVQAVNTLQQSELMYNVENTLFYQVDQMLVENDMYRFLAQLGKMILPSSALYLNKSILNANPDTEYQVDHPEDELIMVPYCQPGDGDVLK